MNPEAWSPFRMAVAFALASAAVPLTMNAQTTPPPAPVPPEVSVDTGYVNYDEAVSLPLGVGFRIPSYNRVDGVVLPWGPFIMLAGGKLNLDPTVTYRSDIGELDPYLKAHFKIGDRDEIELHGGRATFTNDEWIRSDLVNSAAALFVGSDARNYFRADRAVARYNHRFTRRDWTITPSIGALTENAWSTGSAVAHSSAPFSVFGRNDSLKMERPNPSISRGHLTSGLGRLDLAYERDLVTFDFDTRLEVAFDSPGAGQPGSIAQNSVGDFLQLTFGSKTSFPTFGTQRFAFRGHAVVTPGDVAPPQRFAYLGGAGTLATVDLLALGGDNLIFVEGEYSLPLTRPLLPLVGAPILSARYAAGGAGVGSTPDLIQNIGVGIGARLLKAEYHIDPNYRKTDYSSRSAFTIGVSLSF